MLSTAVSVEGFGHICVRAMTLRRGQGSALGHRFRSAWKSSTCGEHSFSLRFPPLSTGKESPGQRAAGHTWLHFEISLSRNKSFY